MLLQFEYIFRHVTQYRLGISKILFALSNAYGFKNVHEFQKYSRIQRRYTHSWKNYVHGVKKYCSLVQKMFCMLKIYLYNVLGKKEIEKSGGRYLKLVSAALYIRTYRVDINFSLPFTQILTSLTRLGLRTLLLSVAAMRWPLLVLCRYLVGIASVISKHLRDAILSKNHRTAKSKNKSRTNYSL
jgi:hypothetical protein